MTRILKMRRILANKIFREVLCVNINLDDNDDHNFDEDDVDVLKIERCVLTNLTLQMPPLDGVRSPDGWITFTRTQARSSWEAPKNHDHDDHGDNSTKTKS